MRRILLSCALLALLTLPGAAAAKAHPPAVKPGYLVVRRAFSDSGVNGRPLAAVRVQGFVLGRISQEARVDIYQLPGESGPQVTGADVSTRAVTWNGLPGREYNGSNFRFRALGGYYRVVVRGSGVYLFAGGHGKITLRGSSSYPNKDGTFSVNGGTFRSMPTPPLHRKLGGG